MKTRTVLFYAVLTIYAGTFFQACSDDDDDSDPEFIASSSDFADFRTWTAVFSHQGPDPALGAAHLGNDETVTRNVFVKDNASRASDGEFPVGTIFVKDTRDESGATMEVTAMVKRGKDFNPDNNDWEWFMLTADGDIAENNGTVLRGADLLDGACGSCHSQAATDDYIFSK